jgi:GGDEF domain-containing protein
MREKLGRPLSLQTALLHHFHSRRGKLKDPVLVPERELSKLRLSALTDPLTGLYNGASFSSISRVRSRARSGPRESRRS